MTQALQTLLSSIKEASENSWKTGVFDIKYDNIDKLVQIIEVMSEALDKYNVYTDPTHLGAGPYDASVAIEQANKIAGGGE